MNNKRDVYRYELLEKGKVILIGLTYDFSRRKVAHRKDFPNATIKQIGRKVTWEEGQKWEKKYYENSKFSVRSGKE